MKKQSFSARLQNDHIYYSAAFKQQPSHYPAECDAVCFRACESMEAKRIASETIDDCMFLGIG